MEIIAYIVLFVLFPVLIYACKKSIDRCHTELKRQSHLLHSQTQTVSELNIWMQYFDEKLIKRESASSHKNGEPKASPSTEKIHATQVTSPNTQGTSPKKRESRPDFQDQASFQSTPVSIYKKTI